MSESYDCLVIGGGFYGLYVAEFLARRGERVALCESGNLLMGRASYANQARVHNGYHYPRSILTALRSRVNYPRFIAEFSSAIDSSFQQVYAIGRRFSKVTADQFYQSMRRIGAEIGPVSKPLRELFDPDYIEAAFITRECAFNASILREIMTDRVENAGVAVHLGHTVESIRRISDEVAVAVSSPLASRVMTAKNVYCCAYAQTNGPGVHSGLSTVPLKHELTELALVEVPDSLKCLGVTVMDGPFFSFMPFPARGLHTLSHVRYTPHFHWYDGDRPYQPAYEVFETTTKTTAYPHMIRDAVRYMPGLQACTYRDSLWEVKTVLPRSETDDSRPILFKSDFGLPGYHLVMGGKIDNVYDVLDVIAKNRASGGR